jgi:hypothetical protein
VLPGPVVHLGTAERSNSSSSNGGQQSRTATSTADGHWQYWRRLFPATGGPLAH